jgi:hypothetical protein
MNAVKNQTSFDLFVTANPCFINLLDSVIKPPQSNTSLLTLRRNGWWQKNPAPHIFKC